MNKQQTDQSMQERRPGATNRAAELQRENPGWSWLKCCSQAKLEWEQERRALLPNTEVVRPAGSERTQSYALAGEKGHQ